MQDGKIQHFIVKTDLAGNTARSVLMGGFGAEQICEASDGTVWSVGQAIGSDGMRQHDADILRHYSFETGLLHSFLPQGTVEAPVRSETAWFSPFGSYVRCGKNKVSVYLRFTNEYVEVNTSSFELMRWKLDEAVVQQREASGLAVTEDGRVYASFDANGIRGAEQVRGLYQIKAVSGNPIAELLPPCGHDNPDRARQTFIPGNFHYALGCGWQSAGRLEDGKQRFVFVVGQCDPH
jgi:hypothetical protein